MSSQRLGKQSLDRVVCPLFLTLPPLSPTTDNPQSRLSYTTGVQLSHSLKWEHSLKKREQRLGPVQKGNISDQKWSQGINHSTRVLGGTWGEFASRLLSL